MGAAFLLCGFLFIIAHKVENSKSLIPSSIHSLVGSSALALVVIQVIAGSQKLHNYRIKNVSTRRWHSDAGLLLWDLVCLSVLTGLAQELSWRNLSTIFTLLAVILTWIAVHVQMKRKFAENNEDVSMDEASEKSGEDEEAAQPSALEEEDFAPL